MDGGSRGRLRPYPRATALRDEDVMDTARSMFLTSCFGQRDIAKFDIGPGTVVLDALSLRTALVAATRHARCTGRRRCGTRFRPMTRSS
jgi:hypothetical protein